VIRVRDAHRHTLGRVRGRPQGFWIAVAFAASAAGLVLDKGFADNTPPYHEPLIAYIGFVAFLVCGAAFFLLCAIAAARAMRWTAIAALPLIVFLVLGITVEEWYFFCLWLFGAIFIVVLALAVVGNRRRRTRG
jgi:hypothetical protein